MESWLTNSKLLICWVTRTVNMSWLYTHIHSEGCKKLFLQICYAPIAPLIFLRFELFIQNNITWLSHNFTLSLWLLRKIFLTISAVCVFMGVINSFALGCMSPSGMIFEHENMKTLILFLGILHGLQYQPMFC